jgi:hypothetical protein
MPKDETCRNRSEVALVEEEDKAVRESDQKQFAGHLKIRGRAIGVIVRELVNTDVGISIIFLQQGTDGTAAIGRRWRGGARGRTRRGGS